MLMNMTIYSGYGCHNTDSLALLLLMAVFTPCDTPITGTDTSSRTASRATTVKVLQAITINQQAFLASPQYDTPNK